MKKCTFGGALRAIRKNKRITLNEMFQRTGVQPAILSRMENDKIVGALNSYRNIAKAFGWKTSTLFARLERLS